MTSIDYGTNPAEAVGIPGINLNDATSAMTQLTFQNIRNLGANGNQPLITNQNDFQIFDNVTWIKGKHTIKSGGSLTLRSREILNADTIVGSLQLQQQHDVELRRPAGAGCTVNSTTGFDVASFLLGYVNSKTAQPVRRRRPTPRSGPEFGLYVQDDFRATSKLTLNLGLRWDVYPPWVEVDDRQSNFDETTGTVRRGLRQRRRSHGVKVGRYLQTYSKGDIGPRSASPTTSTGNGKTIVRGGFGVFWNFTPGGTSSSKAQNPPFLQSTALTPTPTGYGTNLLLEGRPAAASRRRSEPAGGRQRRGRSSTSTSATRYARQWNINVQRAFGTNYMVEVAYVGSQGRHMLLKGDPNQAPPVVGVTDSNVNRPYIDARAGAAHDRPGAEHGHARLQRAAASSSSAGSRTTSRS